MKTLILSSPPVTGDDVKAAQKALANRTFYKGKVDGVYGETTALATKRAKYYLGYKLSNVNNRYDAVTHAYLTGAKQPTAAMNLRRKARLKRVDARQKMYDKAVDLALSKVGVKESPANSNRVEFSSWYGFVSPWCAMFVTWCAVNAGSKVSFKKGSKYAYCPFVYHDSVYGINGLKKTTNPKRGSGVLFDWNNDGVADHIGFFIEWADDKKTSFKTVEGNTSANNAGSQSNGGMVALRTRKTSDVIGFFDWQ